MDYEKYTPEQLDKISEEKKKKPLSNINVMDYLIIICIITVVAFVVTNLYFYYIEGIPPTDNLMKYFFAFFGGELIAMAGITITKNIWGEKRKNR